MSFYIIFLSKIEYPSIYTMNNELLIFHTINIARMGLNLLIVKYKVNQKSQTSFTNKIRKIETFKFLFYYH